MIRAIIRLWFASILCLAVAPAAPLLAQEDSVLSDMAAFRDTNRSSTIFIQVFAEKGGSFEGSGTGILLESGFVLTSLHLVADITEDSFEQALPNKYVTGIVGANQGVEYPLTFIDQNRAQDVALFRFAPDIAETFTGHACVDFGFPSAGDQLGILAFPGGGSLNSVRGFVSGFEASTMLLDITIARGNSGAGVYNTRGRIVGIVQGGLIASGAVTGFGVIIPINFARNLLDQVISDPASHCRKPVVISEAGLDVSYMRLTGALAVPLFIQAQSSGGLSIAGDSPAALGLQEPSTYVTNYPGGQDLTATDGIPVQSGLISNAIADFWIKSEFRQARPLATQLWRKLAADGWIGHRLAADADQSASDLFCLLLGTSPWLLEGQVGDLESAQLPDFVLTEIWGDDAPEYALQTFNAWDDDCSPDPEDKVGFLFVIIQNNGDRTLKNVDITSRSFPADFDPQIWRSAEEAGLTNFGDIALSAEMESFHAVAGSGQPRVRRAPDLAPGESFIWLLSTYRTAPDQYELRYLEAIEVPVELRADAGDDTFSSDIRLPLRNSALPVVMPHGWYRQ